MNTHYFATHTTGQVIVDAILAFFVLALVTGTMTLIIERIMDNRRKGTNQF